MKIYEKMNRREFLKWQGTMAVGSLCMGIPAFGADVPDIGIAVGDPGAATRKAIELLGGINAFVKPGQKVVIKPNMSFAKGEERACNTNPEVVREVAALCKNAKAASVKILDNPLQNAELCIEGVRKACGVFNDDMVHALTRSRFYSPAKIIKGVQMKQTDVMQDVLEADVLIAVPVAKSHGSAGVSLSMKGMMGLIWDRRIMHSRYDLHWAIADLASLLKPQLVVIDATSVLSTNGPSGPGKILRPKTIIASRDMVAADAQTVKMFEWYGRKFAPRQVKHIKIAHEQGLGRMDVENLSIKKVSV